MAIYKTYGTVESSIKSKLAPGTEITADRHRQVENDILDFAENRWLTGDIKKVFCTTQYIEDNFETSGPNVGKGKVGGDREGWAICNGNNGTKNRTGIVSIGYGSLPFGWVSANFSSAGVAGGSKDAVVVTHTHTFEKWDATNGRWWNYPPKLKTTGPTETQQTTGGASNGVPGTDKNMQPYIVILFIQRVPY